MPLSESGVYYENESLDPFDLRTMQCKALHRAGVQIAFGFETNSWGNFTRRVAIVPNASIKNQLWAFEQGLDITQKMQILEWVDKGQFAPLQTYFESGNLDSERVFSPSQQDLSDSDIGIVQSCFLVACSRPAVGRRIPVKIYGQLQDQGIKPASAAYLSGWLAKTYRQELAKHPQIVSGKGYHQQIASAHSV
jgi:hypothetical protein